MTTMTFGRQQPHCTQTEESSASLTSLTLIDVENSDPTPFSQYQTHFDKFLQALWHDVGPKNPLKRSFFISYKTLTAFRYFALIVNITALILGIYKESMNETPNYFFLTAFLTYWGLGFCLIHSILVIFWSNAPDSSYKWKIVYLIGEIGFTLETLICPFFMCILFPGILLNYEVNLWDIAFQMLTHLIVPALICCEIVFSNISFPKSHKYIILVLMLGYCFINYCWMVALNQPIYPPIDWKTCGSHACIAISAALLLSGFSLGGFIHKVKKGYKYVELSLNNKI